MSKQLKALLLCAGFGTRLRPITNKIPKCLVKVNNKTILENWLNKLEDAGFSEVLINTHYLHKKVTDYLQKLLNVNFSNSLINRAIELSSFDRLQSLEESKGFSESVIDPNSGNRKKFFNLGPKNDWNKILNKQISDEIEQKFQNEMTELGYL